MNWVSSAIVDGSSTAHLSVKYLWQQKQIKREIPRQAVQNNIELSHQVNKIGMALSGCVLAEIKVKMINLQYSNKKIWSSYYEQNRRQQ